jgi:hypothetical protein
VTSARFQSFFEEATLAEMLPNFCVYHINAPGQEFGAEKLPGTDFMKRQLWPKTFRTNFYPQISVKFTPKMNRYKFI